VGHGIATGYFGGVMQGPYAAANAALDAFADHLHTEATRVGAISECRSIEAYSGTSLSDSHRRGE
jgi:hypothetical protein